MMISIILIIITVILSISGFQKPEILWKYDFSPYRIANNKEYYRFISHAFLHADWAHLLINMIVLFSFGTNMEIIFKQYSQSGYFRFPVIAFILLYFGGILASTLTTFFRNRNKQEYSAIGASGAVSAVVFASIFFSPFGKILFFGVLPVPGIVFGILYLLYSSYMSKKGSDNINHDAHFWGAVYGFIFPLLMNFSLINIFIKQLTF